MKTKRRGVSNLKRGVRSSLTQRGHSARADYLEIFIREKHKARLHQERSNLNGRISQINDELACLEKEVKNLKLELEEDKPGAKATDKIERIPKTLKTISIDY
jgi:predicted  nucleic acid-binding Zn-ribbon protein